MSNETAGRFLSQPVFRNYPVRVLSYSLTALAIAYGIYLGSLPTNRYIAVACCLAYPHITTLLLYFLKQHIGKKALIATHMADTANLGALLTISGLPLLETPLFITMLVSTGLISFGVRSLFYSVPTLLIAIEVIHRLFQPELLVVMPPELTLFCIVIFALNTFIQSRQLRLKHKAFTSLSQEAEQQQERYIELAHSLAKYLSPQVWESIFLGKKAVKLGSQRKKLTLFFSDIKGFTELSEELEPETLTELLNQYLTEMSDIALQHGGTIDKFVGDSMVVFFGDPKTRGAKEDARAAVSMALAMREQMTVLRRKWLDQGIEKPLEIRMGINTGYCTVGNFGADNRMDYTIIGKEVNLASRLESVAKAGDILISHKTWSLIKDIILCQTMGDIQVKGFSRPLSTYRVLDFRRNLGSSKKLLTFETKGFAMSLDLNSVEEHEVRRIVKTLKLSAKELLEKTF